MIKIGDISLGEFPLLLAPMEDVSDPPFRAVCKKNGADLMFTEFISAEGLIRDGRKSIQKLEIYDYERPIGIQIFGANIDSMMAATEIATRSNPEIIDINYGCPVKKVAGRGAGAGLLQDIDKMVEMTKKIIESTHLPVTVKTRLGWDEDTKYIKEVAYRLQDIGIHALSIHGRTRKQMYKGQADWTLIGEIANDPNIEIPIFGNGDVTSPEVAKEKKDLYGVQGIMVGRAAIGYPWIFREIKHYLKTGQLLDPPTIDERVENCKEHLLASLDWKGERTGMFEMRKHYSNYFKRLPNFKPFRQKLVTAPSIADVLEILDEVKSEYQYDGVLDPNPPIDVFPGGKA